MTVARLPLVPADSDDDVVAAVFARFADEGRTPIALYRVLAHAPAVLRGYSGLAQALRYDAATPRALRELLVLRTAQRTGSAYEWAHHVPMARQAGVREAQVEALDRWPESDEFDRGERAVLRLADELHDVALSDEGFAELRACFPPGEVVELVLAASFYQAVARLLQGFDVEVEPDYRQWLSSWR